MLSRVADSIYWMSRYIERAENVARFIDVNLNLTLDLPGGPSEQWRPLVVTTGDQDRFEKRCGEATRENVIHFLTFDSENPNSILSCLRSARENARSIREIISSEMWEQINWFYLMVNEAATGEWIADTPHFFFNEVKKARHLFNGITDATMTHGEAWNFCRMGRMLERADKTSRILDVKYYILLPTVSDVGTPFDDIQWTAVLQSTSAFEMYRKRYHYISPGKILEFLLLDREFPRSIYYCLLTADEALHQISGTVIGSFSNLAEQRLGQLRSEFAYIQIDSVIEKGVHQFIDSFQLKLNHVGRAIFETFFARRPVTAATQSQRMPSMVQWSSQTQSQSQWQA
jgi:uncharacterized alpha-E superfamily protein